MSDNGNLQAADSGQMPDENALLEDSQAAEKYADLTRRALLDSFTSLISSADINNLKADVDRIKSEFYKKLKDERADLREKYVSEHGSEDGFTVDPDPLEEEFKNIFDKYRVLRDGNLKLIEESLLKNYEEKKEILSGIKELISSEDSINLRLKRLKSYQQKWKQTGEVNARDEGVLWEEYHHLIDNFYEYAKVNSEARDRELLGNLEKKLNLCSKAEDLLLEPLIVPAFRKLQEYHKQWKETGSVPAEKREEIWDRFREASKKINKKHQDYFETLKTEQSNHLKEKTILCEKAEEINTLDLNTYNDWEAQTTRILELQKMWKTIGLAPRKENREVFRRFRKACNNFFTLKKEFNIHHKNDLEENFKKKTILCESVEKLKDSTDWKNAFQRIKELQEEWKKIGPVDRKKSQALWDRFRKACDEFFSRKSEFFRERDTELDENLKLKKEIIEKVKNFQIGGNNHENIECLKGFQKEWTLIGHIPFRLKESMYRDFREAIDSHFKSLKANESRNIVEKYKKQWESGGDGSDAEMKKKNELLNLKKQLNKIETDVDLWERNIGFFSGSGDSDSLLKDVNNKISRAKNQISTIKEKIRVIKDMG